MKTRQELAFEEVRSLRDIAMRLCQWGVTVLVALQSSLYFVRKDTFERLLVKGEVAKGDLLPFRYYIIGTLALLMVAGIFTVLVNAISRRYRFYRAILEDDPDKLIPQPRRPRRTIEFVFILFFLFPLFDLAVRYYIWIEIGSK